MLERVRGDKEDTEPECIEPGNLAVIALASVRSIGFASPSFDGFAFFLRDWLCKPILDGCLRI